MSDGALIDDPLWLSRTRFERLSLAVRELTAARRREDVIEIVRHSARQLSGAMGVAIVLKDGDKCHYLVEDSKVPLWQGQRFPMTACISGWAMLNRRQVVISNIYLDDRIPHDAYQPTGVHSLVMTPVGDDEPFAALGAYWSEVRDPAADEIAVLSALAHCMATALENIRLVENLQDEARRQQVLINELNHRVKNTLAIIQSIARQSLRGERPLKAAAADFEARLMALSGAHNLITDTFWMSAPLGDLVTAALKPFGYGADEGRFTVEGPELRLEPRSAVAFALALHELGTNAAKYGSLSVPEGRVAVDWRIAGGDRLEFSWVESGGPTVRPPATRGLGSRLIERGLASELNGAVKLAFPPEGVTCEIDAPLPDQAYTSEELAAGEELPERQRRAMQMFPGALRAR